MRSFMMKIFGITDLIEEQKKTNKLLEKIHYECKRNSDLVSDYNKQYNIK